ncbi:hypothetical protein AB0903_32745 [Streptomyces sp. NPDC048389]
MITRFAGEAPPLPDERVTPSDVVLPGADSSLRQVEEILSDEGLIPG